MSAPQPLAPVELAANGAGEPAPHGGGRLVSLSAGWIGAAGLSTASVAIFSASRAGDPRRVAPAGEAADVEVVDDLAEEVADVLDEDGVALGVAGDAEARQRPPGRSRGWW